MTKGNLTEDQAPEVIIIDEEDGEQEVHEDENVQEDNPAGDFDVQQQQENEQEMENIIQTPQPQEPYFEYTGEKILPRLAPSNLMTWFQNLMNVRKQEWGELDSDQFCT
jgi:hypothetical protein